MLQKRIRMALGLPFADGFLEILCTGIGMEVELLQDRVREGLKPLIALFPETYLLS